MLKKEIVFFGQMTNLVCDGKCEKAWGINERPKGYCLEEDHEDYDDDYYYIPDGDLGDAPVDPQSSEGGQLKPSAYHTSYDFERTNDMMNKWCARECERSEMFNKNEEIKLIDLSKPYYNVISRNEV